MYKISILSVVTASLLFIGCSDEVKVEDKIKEDKTLYIKKELLQIVDNNKTIDKNETIEKNATQKKEEIKPEVKVLLDNTLKSEVATENIKKEEVKTDKLVLEKEKQILPKAKEELALDVQAISPAKDSVVKEKELLPTIIEITPVVTVKPIKEMNTTIASVVAVKPIREMNATITPVVTVKPIKEVNATIASVVAVKPIKEVNTTITSVVTVKPIAKVTSIITPVVAVSTIEKIVVSKPIKPIVPIQIKVIYKNKPFDYQLQAQKVSENVWCFFGAIEGPTKENAGNMVNSCYIKTNEGYLVMDTGPSYQFAKQSYEVMQKIEELPVKYVVNSHEHDDHWLGNDFYKQKFDTYLIGPESINTNYKDGDKTRMYNVLPANAIKGTHIIKLDKTPKKPYTLTIGGEEFRIIPMDTQAHTGDDIFIYMPKRKVLFAGDLVMNGRITSNRHGSVIGQIKALAMMKKLDWNVMVPGHGFITDATAMDEAELYFKLTKERVLKAINEGLDATQINEAVKLIEFKDKAMYDILNPQNIAVAFEELEMLEDE